MAEHFKVMRAWDKGRNKVAYVYRDQATGNTKIGECLFYNWFYIKKSDYDAHRSLLFKFKEEKTISSFEDIGKYVKVFYDRSHASESLNKDMEYVWEYRDYNFRKMLEKLKMIGVQTYEADVQAWKRWLIQDEVSIDTDYKIAYYDIETDDRHSDGLTPGKYRILSIAFKYSDSKNADGKMVWLVTKEDTDEAEIEMLTRAAKIINSVDVVVSFNGKNFDDPYIKSRFMRYGIIVDWRKVFLQDHCWTFKKYGPTLTSHSLDNISKSVLGRGKVDHTGLRIWDMWNNNRALLEEYNREDVQLMYDIECKTGFLSAHRDISAIGMCSVDDLYVSRKIDNFILKQAQEDNEFHFKTVERNYDEETEDKSYEGAFVFPAVVGKHRNVRVVDFSSLYPNVINTFNISPDTFIEADDDVPDNMIITTPTRHRYRKDFIGILPKVVMKLAQTRKYYKELMSKETPGSMEHKVLDRMQYTYKYFGLSFYGCMGERHNRAYDPRIAESITLTGQYFTKNCAKYAENNKIPVIYGDSITKERNTVIMIDDEISIVSFEDLYAMTKLCRSVDGEKEIGRFEKPILVLSYNFKINQSEWKPIKCVIRHKTNKKVYLYRYPEGITKVTEDHSLIDSNGNVFKPTEHFNAFSIPALKTNRYLQEFDLRRYLQNDIDKFNSAVSPENIHALLRLCANYICNSSTIQTDDICKFFPDFNTNLFESVNSFLKQLCGDRNTIPAFIYNLESKYQKFFIEEIMNGKCVYESTSVNVISGLSYLMRMNNYKILCKTNKESFTIISPDANYEAPTNETGLEEIEYDDYVYDLSVEDNNNFVDAMGNILLHNTDSLFLIGLNKHSNVMKMIDKLSQLCELHAIKKFNCDVCTIKMDYDKGFKTYLTLAKKRYAGVLDYLDGHFITDFNMYIAGLEYKRTDVTSIVKKWQYELLKVILETDEDPAFDDIRSMILKWKSETCSGKLTADDIVISQKITKDISEYDGRQMHVMIAEEMKADGKEIWVGDKVQYFIIGIDSMKKPIPKPIYKFNGKYCESYYWDNKIFPALHRILEVVYPKADWASYYMGSGEVKMGRTNLW